MRLKTTMPPALMLGLALALPPAPSRADFVFDVTLDTSPLNAPGAAFGGGGPYSIDFTLTGADPAQANSVRIAAIDLGGGSAMGPASTINGAAGDLTSGVILDDSGGWFFNDFNQVFLPGASLSFEVATTADFAGVAPDLLSFSILDAGGDPIPTGDPTGGGALFFVTLDGPSPSLTDAFSGTDSSGTLMIGPPSLTRAVPEPSSVTLLVLGGAALLRGRRRPRPADALESPPTRPWRSSHRRPGRDALGLRDDSGGPPG